MQFDPQIISATIGGIVSLITGYMTYRVGMKPAEQSADKPDEDTLKQGESALSIVRTSVSQYGNDDEKADLANFERNPPRYAEQLRQVLTDIATRYPVFMEQLDSFAQQNDLKRGQVRGSVNVSGQGRIYGNTAGVNQGDMTGTYNFGTQDEKQ